MSMSELDKIIAQVQKEKGKAVIIKGGIIEPCIRIPTGIFPLDLATGGGIPLGRVTEIYGMESSGKTSVSLLAAAHVQNVMKKKAVFVDIENTLDFEWARTLGVNIEELVVIHPDSAEQVVDLVEAVLHAEDVGIVIIDSLASMTPQNEIDSGAEKQIVGGSSALVGKMMRKSVVALTTEAKRGHFPALVCLNQIRHKIGCFDYTSPVWLADGSTMPIGKIVNGKLEVEVMSANDDGTVVPRKVIGWANNGEGPPDEWINITVAGGNSGRRMLKVTKGHSIYTPYGEKLAGDLVVGDFVSTEGTQYYTDEQHEVILGSILGDGCLRFEKGSTRGHLRIGHGYKQSSYAQYKADIFGSTLHTNKIGVDFYTNRSLEFAKYTGIVKKKGLIHLPQEYVDALTLRALTIWYLDDGTYGGSHARWGWGKPSISTKTLSIDSLARIAVQISKLGAGVPSIKEGRGLQWNGLNARDLFQAISPYVHPSMSYKLKHTFKVGAKINIKKMQPYNKIFAEPIVKITECTVARKKYDITIQGNHNYLVNGVLVHNTMFGDPETTSGGNSPRFAYSLRLRLYAKDKNIKEVSNELPAFRTVSGIIKKWKVPVNGRNFEYDFCLIPHDNIKIGGSPSWNTVASRLKDFGVIAKTLKGWSCMGVEFKTLAEIQSKYEAEPVLKMALQAEVIKLSAKKMLSPQVTEGKIAGFVDMTTGEVIND